VSDLGLETVAYLRARYQIEDAWLEGRERGFRWWPATLAQEIWAEPAWDDDGIVVYRVHVRTDLLAGLGQGEAAVSWLGSLLRGASSLSAAVVEADGRVRLAASLYVHEQNAVWTQPLLAWVGLLQASEARAWALLAEAGRVASGAWSAHRVSGPRTAPDELAHVVEALVQPLGREPSRYAGSELEHCVALLQQPPVLLATGGPRGLTAELPFGASTSLLRLLTDAEHPRLGKGLLVLLTLPVPGLGARHALELNRRELQQGERAALLGTWVAGEVGPTFAAFYPNAVYREGLTANVALGSVVRACRTAEWLLGPDWAAGSATSFDRLRARAQGAGRVRKGVRS